MNLETLVDRAAERAAAVRRIAKLYHGAVAARDEAIRDAAEAGPRALGRATGITPGQIHRITHPKRKAD
jgi:hypothetical protein